MIRAVGLVFLSIALSGCVTSQPRSDLSSPQREASDLNAKLGDIVLESPRSTEDQYQWVQPKNLDEDCKVFISNQLAETVASSHAYLYWDGGCKNGYAHGLGREFVSSSLDNEEPVDLYFLTDYQREGGAAPARYIEHNFVNDVTKEGDLISGYYLQNVYSKSRLQTYNIPPWLKELFQFDPEYVGDLYFGFMGGDGKSIFTELTYFSHIVRSIRGDAGARLEIHRNIGDSNSFQQYSATTYFLPKLPMRNLYEIELNAPKMRWFGVSRRTLEPGTIFERAQESTSYKGVGEANKFGDAAPDQYFEQLEGIELRITKISELALYERLIALSIKGVYLANRCHEQALPSFIAKEKYRQICGSLDRDRKVTNYIFSIDEIRRNRDVLSEYFSKDHNNQVLSAALSAPPPLLLNPIQVKVSVPNSLAKYLPEKSLAERLGQFLFVDEVAPDRGDVGLTESNGLSTQASSFGLEYDLKSPEGRQKFSDDIRSTLRAIMEGRVVFNEEVREPGPGHGIFQHTRPIQWTTQ